MLIISSLGNESLDGTMALTFRKSRVLTLSDRDISLSCYSTDVVLSSKYQRLTDRRADLIVKAITAL